MATFVSIRAKVKAKLDAITEFAFVQDFHETDLTGFPAVTFDIASETGTFLTNKENQRKLVFNIIIYQEITSAGLNKAKRIVDERSLQVIDAFANDFSLGGEVDFCTPLAGQRGQFDAGHGKVFFQQLDLECTFTFLTV